MSSLPVTTSLPGPDRVQQRLAPVLRGEQQLHDHVELLEEAEDAKKTKAGIEVGDRSVAGCVSSAMLWFNDHLPLLQHKIHQPPHNVSLIHRKWKPNARQ
jgi:hypothetical protein